MDKKKWVPFELLNHIKMCIGDTREKIEREKMKRTPKNVRGHCHLQEKMDSIRFTLLFLELSATAVAVAASSAMQSGCFFPFFFFPLLLIRCVLKMFYNHQTNCEMLNKD